MANPIRAHRLAAALLSTSLFAGCATHERMADTAVNAHMAQGRATDQMLLLNIVRASLLHPLHFSRIDTMSMTVGSEMPSIDLGLGFGPGADNRARGIKLAGGGAPTTMDVAPLDSKEFMQGLATPLSADWMAYFFEQGWPKRAVLKLFIERIDGLPSGVSAEQQISIWSACSGLEVTVEPGAAFGPPIATNELGAKVSLVDALNSGATLQGIPATNPSMPAKTYQLRMPGTESRVLFVECPEGAKSTSAGGKSTTTGVPLKPNQLLGGLVRSNDSSQKNFANNFPRVEGKPDAETEAEPRIVLRSAERMIRYLGREAGANPNALLRVQTSGAPVKPAVQVKYAGGDYWIETEDAGVDGVSSIGTLALMQQVLQLKATGGSVAQPTQSLRIRVTR
jgi:hypothetical protein